MSIYSVPTVKFKCCNTTVEFHSPRMFQYCDCGKSAYDSSDGRTARYLGNFDDIEVLGYNLTKDMDYCKKWGIDYNLSDKVLTCKDWENFLIKITSFGGYVVIEDKGDLGLNVGKTYSRLRDARKSILKAIRSK